TKPDRTQRAQGSLFRTPFVQMLRSRAHEGERQFLFVSQLNARKLTRFNGRQTIEGQERKVRRKTNIAAPRLEQVDKGKRAARKGPSRHEVALQGGVAIGTRNHLSPRKQLRRWSSGAFRPDSTEILLQMAVKILFGNL